MNTLISRRQLSFASGLYVGTLAIAPSISRTEEPYADAVAAEKWLSPYLHAPGAVHGALHMGRFRDRTYYLDKEIKWTPGPNQQGPTVEVPIGFVTDLASIPRIFWSLLPTDGSYTFAAIVHDYLYWTQPVPRDVADKVFLFGMDDLKVPSYISGQIYTAVRARGHIAWEQNQTLRSAGEKRLLREFPTDPTTTWAEWKARKDCCSFI
jgi:hypothetical protein